MPIYSQEKLKIDKVLTAVAYYQKHQKASKLNFKLWSQTNNLFIAK